MTSSDHLVDQRAAQGTAKDAAKDAAAAAATQTLLNCYLREADGWQIEDDLLTIDLPEGQLRAQLAFRSRTHHHRFHLPVELLRDGRATPVRFVSLVDLLLAALGTEQAGSNRNGLRERMLSSLSNVATFLDRRRDDIDRLWSPGPLSFIESEQAQLLGHPLHPTPKSRQPMTEGAVLRYSPETRGRFQLHWLAASPAIVRQDCAFDARGTTAADLSAKLAGPSSRWGASRIPIPAHPWELEHLKTDPDVAGLFKSGDLVDLGTRGEVVLPTTSVRTVYQESWPWQLKFSLHVRVTNSERVTLPKELERAVESARLWQTEAGAAARRIAPAFTPIQDPAYLAIAPEGPHGKLLDGFSVLFRENPWPARTPGTAANVTSLTSLCQDHPFGGTSRLGQIVGRLASSRAQELTEVGRDWFARFLDVAVVSLVRLYLDLGLCFEAHQQNMLVELDAAGLPVHCFYRDSQGYFHRELAHADLCRIIPNLGEASESIFPEALADERLVYYPFLNLALGVVDALGAAGCADEAVLLADLRRGLEKERARDTRYPATLLDRLLDDDRWPCKGNLRTRWCEMDELVGDIAEQSVYVSIPNPLTGLGGEG